MLCLKRGRRAAVVLGLVSFSHFVLDLPMHRADMPILPGNASDLPRLGFGLRRLPAVSAVVELLLVLAGSLFYCRAAVDVAQSDPARLKCPHTCGALALGAGIVTRWGSTCSECDARRTAPRTPTSCAITFTTIVVDNK